MTRRTLEEMAAHAAERVAQPRSPLQGPIPTSFPWDFPEEQIMVAIGHVREELAWIEEGLKAVEKAAGLKTPDRWPADKEAARRAREAAADEAAGRGRSLADARRESRVVPVREKPGKGWRVG